MTTSSNSRRTSHCRPSRRRRSRTRTRSARAPSRGCRTARSGSSARSSARRRSTSTCGTRARACTSTTTPCRRSRACTRAQRRTGRSGPGARVRNRRGSLCTCLLSLIFVVRLGLVWQWMLTFATQVCFAEEVRGARWDGVRYRGIARCHLARPPKPTVGLPIRVATAPDYGMGWTGTVWVP